MTPGGEHVTNAPFSKDEIAVIRKAMATPGATVDCPRCGTLLASEGPAVAQAKSAVVWLYCTSCKRNLIVRDWPDKPDRS